MARTTSRSKPTGSWTPRPRFRLVVLALQFFSDRHLPGCHVFHPPDIMTNYAKHPIGILVPIVVVVSLASCSGNPNGKEKLAFVASSLYVTFMLVARRSLSIRRSARRDHNTTSPFTTPPPEVTDSASAWSGGRLPPYCSFLFCFRLPQVSRQGASGRRALLAIAEVRGQIAEVSSEVRSQRSDCRGEKLQAHAAV